MPAFEDFESYYVDEVLGVFGKNVGYERKKQGLSISAIAKEAQYDRGCLSKVEFGKQNLEYATSIRIAKALNVPYPNLFSREYMVPKADSGLDSLHTFREDDYLLVFVRNFRKQMKRKRKCQYAVATATGKYEASISQVMNGVNKNPELKLLAAMAYVAEIDMFNMYLRVTE